MAECSIRTLTPPAIALVMARKGQAGAAASAAARAFGVALPDTPRAAVGEDIVLLWCGPERWLALVPEQRAAAEGGIEAMLAPIFSETARVADQSGSRVLVEVSGEQARDVLARGLPVDLHPRVFGPGDTALCRAAYVSMQVWQASADPTFVLAVPRSYASGFIHWLEGVAKSVGTVP